MSREYSNLAETVWRILGPPGDGEVEILWSEKKPGRKGSGVLTYTSDMGHLVRVGFVCSHCSQKKLLNELESGLLNIVSFLYDVDSDAEVEVDEEEEYRSSILEILKSRAFGPSSLN